MQHIDETVTVSLARSHCKVLERWCRQSGRSRSAVVRLAIEHLSDTSLKQHGIFGLTFQRPEWQEKRDG